MNDSKTFFNQVYADKVKLSFSQRMASKIRNPFYKILKSSINRYEESVLSAAQKEFCLELGIGAEGLELELCRNGAQVYAIDISEIAIKNAYQRLAGRKEYDNIKYICGNAEETQLSGNSFDLIYGKWILHHLDIKKSINEIVRLLKPDGKAIFLEPLGTNPVINLFRKLSPQLRVKDEHPLSMEDLSYVKTKFKDCQFEYYHFLFFLVPFVSAETIKKLENYLLKKFPSLKFLCWQVLIVLSSPLPGTKK